MAELQDYMLTPLSLSNKGATQTETDKVLTTEKVEQITTKSDGYVTPTGTIGTTTTWHYSELIPVVEGEEIFYTGDIIGAASQAVLAFDSGSTVVSQLLLDGTFVNESVIIPAGVAFVQATSIKNNGLSIRKNGVVGKIIPTAHKSWTAIGDSLTSNTDYQTQVATQIVFKSIINQGYSGLPLTTGHVSGSIIASTSAMVFSDIYTLLVGTNDFKLDMPLGLTTDYDNNTGDATFYGALRVMMDRIFTLNPSADVLLMTTYRRDNSLYTSYSTNGAGHTLINYNDALKYVASKEALPLLDLFNISGITDRNLTIYTDDGLHPNGLGDLLTSPKITGAMKTMLGL